MSSQLSIFGPEPVVELAAEEPPVFWPAAEDEPAPECEEPAVTLDPDALFKRWCRGAWLSDAEMLALKAWALARD